jgi:hypothetical protein
MHLNRACQRGSCVSINFLIFFDGELGVRREAALDVAAPGNYSRQGDEICAIIV